MSELGKLDHSSSPRIIIVGAGVGGLTFAISLKRRYGYQNFIIYEKTHGVGGTWHENTYPGCSSDIPINFYSLSTDRNPDWTCSHPFQPEIEAYWNGLREKYSLTSHIKYGTLVVKAVWDSSGNLYHVTTKDLETGMLSTTSAQILVSALGFLEIPKYPSIPGLADFKGELFHSARWVNNSLVGKRVAVIGNGASATQFLPIIAKESGIHVTQFCRTPQWFFPPLRTYYSNVHKLACRYMPLYMRFRRFLDYLISELVYLFIFSNSITRRQTQKLFKRYITSTAPEEYHDVLVPKYELGCRRVVVDTDYLPALHRSNVRVKYDGIVSIDKDGITTNDGEHLHFDTIILATGYSAHSYPLQLEGKDGRTITDYYDLKGGPTAYLGTTVPGFPNLYMIGGPNTASGHTSAIFTEEVQVNYTLDLIKPLLDGRLSSIDVTHEATERYNEKLQNRLSRSVFVGCNSWYRLNGTGKVNSMFPGSSALFWWWLRRPVWEDYEVTGRDAGKRQRRGFLTIPTLTFALAIVAAGACWALDLVPQSVLDLVAQSWDVVVQFLL